MEDPNGPSVGSFLNFFRRQTFTQVVSGTVSTDTERIFPRHHPRGATAPNPTLCRARDHPAVLLPWAPLEMATTTKVFIVFYRCATTGDGMGGGQLAAWVPGIIIPCAECAEEWGRGRGAA